jgi:outer membrane protein assembly factor BamB
MFFRTRRFRASPSAWIVALAVAAVGGLVNRTEHAAAQQIQFQVNPSAPPDEDPYGVYLPTDRTLSRGVSRARERLESGEFNEALAFLQQLLDRNEDVFVDDGADPNKLRGLKAAARELISKLPAAGREMYVLLHTAAARRELNAALESGDRDRLAQLVRRYFLTAPGYEAAIVLAQTELDRGHPLAAAHLYQQLLADPAVAAEFEPQLSLLAGVSWRAAGRPESAAAALRALAEKSPGVEVEIAGKKISLPNKTKTDAELLAWLDESAGHVQAVDNAAADWLTLRGDPARNTEHRGGAPHLSARWESRVVNDPRFENFLTTRREQAEQQGLVAVAAARPIATGNVVLMRTPQNVVALDWQTGKRIWETREEESSARDQYLAEFMSDNNNGDEFAAMNHPLEQRVWDDTLTMSISSDGERVFVLGGMALGERDDQSIWNAGPGFGGPFDFTAAPTNRLTAYELATEGKLAWEIDGANASGDLSGVFFLGAPVAVDGSLYVLAEIRSAIYLLALEPATGKLQWRQQLAGLEQAITLDPPRRLNASSPSYSAGILVCPTTAGIVVAIDVIRREFAWVYRYPRQMDSFANIRPGWQGRTEVPFPRGNTRWLDGSAVIADGKVLISPPESAELHCLDLATGKLLWKKPREKSLFLACVDQGNVLLVAADSVTALRVADGAAAWPKDFALPNGSLPAGLGYLSEGCYFLPVTSGQVIAINTTDGTSTTAIEAPSDVSVGNLICHRGSIISQSAIFLDKFEQIEVLRERAKAALVENPKNAAAIRDLAEMRRLEGALAEAVPMLKQAYEIDPSDLLTRDMLADALLEALNSDYAAYRADLPLLRTIVDRPQQQIDLLRIDAQGLDAAGERMQAFAAYLRLVDATSADLTPLTISPQNTARSDSWIRAQLNALWSAATADERSEITRQLETRQKTWTSPPAISDLRTYLGNFGGLPGTDGMRRQLVRRLLERNEPLDVEIELFRLNSSRASESQAAAAILLTQWLIDQGRHEEGATMARSIEQQWSKAAAVDGRTPREWLERWRPELSEVASQSIPSGRVTVEDLPATAANRPEITRRAQAEYQLGLRKLRLEQVAGPRLGPSQWLIAQDGSRLVGRDGTGQDSFRFNASRRSALRRFGGNSDMVQAAQLGDLLYVTLGGQIVAIDTRERGENDKSDIVWQSNPSSRFAVGAPRTVRRNAPPLYHAWSQRRRMPGAAGGLVATLGPATPNGVVFQDQQQLRCADPASGETLWSRNDIPVGCELFGDDEFVLAADPEGKALYVLRMSDGELVEKRSLPETPWLLTSGRNVAVLAETKGDGRSRKMLQIIDAVSGKALMEQEFDAGVRMTTLEPNLLAIVEPGGEFQLIDVRTTDTLITQKLALASAPRSISMFPAGERLFLCVSGPAQQQSSRPIGLDYPLVDGQVYAFDLRDGRMQWPGPAVIESRGIALNQPTDIPLLVFVDRVVKRDAGGSGTKLRLLCLDRDTGATIYRNDDLPDTSGGQFRIRATRGAAPAVDIEMNAKTIRFRMSNEPRSPEPPANDLVEAPRKSLGRGLWGVTRRMGSVLQDVIQNSGGQGSGVDVDNESGNGNEGQIDDD